LVSTDYVAQAMTLPVKKNRARTLQSRALTG